ncbi:MAG: hypothetical protein H6R00_381, partial [Proteobacteria bacterium]|nr:hypothetical protein [Pseudomonadota bacterium]
ADVAEALLHDLVERHLLGAVDAERVHHRFLRLAAEDQAGGVSLGIAAVDEHVLAVEVGESRRRVLRGGGLADAALAVDGYLARRHVGVSWEVLGGRGKPPMTKTGSQLACHDFSIIGASNGFHAFSERNVANR